MSQETPLHRFAFRIGCLLFSGAVGLVAWTILLAFFSPRWVDFKAWSLVPEFAEWAVSVRRGALVLDQVRDPLARIADPVHSILQYRLLIPLLGRTMKLEGSTVLAIAHIGSWLLLSVVIGFCRHGWPSGMGSLRVTPGSWQLFDALSLAVVFGASSWFFVSNAWLGYYDSLVVMGLVVVVISPWSWPIAAMCLCGPWIDERFILGFPPAMALRWLLSTEPGVSGVLRVMRALTIPSVILVVQLAIRLHLAGSQASPGLAAYFHANGMFAFLQTGATDSGPKYARLALGVWEGLRLGWVVIALGVVALACRREMLKIWVFLGVVVAGIGVGLASANDLSRSMMLVAPAVLVAWIWARQLPFWSFLRMSELLAVAALAGPAQHVVTNFTSPIRPVWEEQAIVEETPAVAYARLHVGWRQAYDPGVPRNYPEAARWFRLAADDGYGPAQLALGQFLLQENTGLKDERAAFGWIRAAALQDLPEAEYTLGLLWERGVGTTPDPVRAVRYFARAARKHHGAAQFNLAAMCANGSGTPRNPELAAAWLRIAARDGQRDAAAALAAFEAPFDESGRSRIGARVKALDAILQNQERLPVRIGDGR